MIYRNVLNFSDVSSVYGGNFVDSLKTLKNYLRGKNHVMFYLFPKATEEREWAQELNDVFFLKGNYLKNVRYISKIIRENGIDIIHIHFHTIRTLLLFYPFRKKCKIVIHLHNMFSISNPIKKIIHRFLIKGANLITCSDVTLDTFMFRQQINKAIVARNAISFDRLGKYENVPELDSYKEYTKIMLFGFDYERKGVDITLDALNELDEKGYKVKLILILSKNREEVFQKINDRYGKIPEFLLELPPTNNIGSYYKACDIFVSSSRSEGFCCAIYEAAYVGCNVIASDIPSQKEAEIDDMIFFKNEDVADLKSKLIKCIENGKLSDQDIIKRRGKIEKKYGLQQWDRKIVEFYDEL